MPTESMFVETARRMEHYSRQYPSALLAFSGGKDSLVIADMAKRYFKTVVGFFMYFVPGLRSDAERLRSAERLNIPILQYPHFSFLEALRAGIYCIPGPEHEALPKCKRKDIWAMAREDSGIKLILTGMKKSDSMARRRTLDKYVEQDVYHPLIMWKNFDVLAYCKIHKITLPPAPKGRKSTGTDLRGESLLFLYEQYPDDFERIAKWFPFIHAVVARERIFYGYKGTRETERVHQVHSGEDSPQASEERGV